MLGSLPGNQDNRNKLFQAVFLNPWEIGMLMVHVMFTTGMFVCNT